VVVNARTECQDLQWHFDAVGRLGEAQILAYTHTREEEVDVRQHLHPRRFLSPGPLWWAFDWASALVQYRACPSPVVPIPPYPEGWQPSDGSVLLLDEIDKADTDLANSLLETLGNSDFPIPYEQTSVRQSADSPAPLLIITTNEERELPAAFLRRCLVLHLSLPEDEADLLAWLCRRGAVHFQDQCSTAVRERAAHMLLRDRKHASDQGLPPPGQAEYLDLLRAVCILARADEPSQLDWLERLGAFVLQKSSTLRS
jgi:hypothetical protein